MLEAFAWRAQESVCKCWLERRARRLLLAPIDPDDLASLGRGPPVEEFRQALLQEGRGSGPRRAAAGTGPVRRSGRAGQVVHC